MKTDFPSSVLTEIILPLTIKKWKNADTLLPHMKELLKTPFYNYRHVVQQELDRVLPGCCPQRCDPSLEDSHEEFEGIFSNYHKIYSWKKNAAVDDESYNNSHHVHPKLLCNHF